MAGARQNISRNYDPNRTKSNILFLRNRSFNFLRGWVNKFVAKNVIRSANVNSLGHTIMKGLVSDPEFKNMTKQYGYESKIYMRQTVGMLALLGLATTAFQLSD